MPKKLLFHLIPFIYGTPENRTFRPENGSFSQSTHSWRSTVNGSFSQSTHSWSSTVFVGFFRRIHDGKPLRLRPRPSASILNVKQNLPHFQKSGSVLAPHLELNELDARVTPCELHARYRLHRSENLHGNMRWKALAEIHTMHSFAPFSTLKIFVRNC